MIISCAKSKLPVLGGAGWEGHPFSRAVLLREGRRPVAGWYDGAGSLGGIDLQAAGLIDEIRAGTACLVLGDRYQPGDAPAALGPSNIEPDPERRPDREFVAACARLGGFATYEGYVLARDGKVSPEVGAALTDKTVSTLRQVTEGLRQAIAERLATLASASSKPVQEIEKLLMPAIWLDVVPLDAECRRLRLLGGPGLRQGGMPIEFRIDRDVASSALHALAADLVGWFPPRKKASVILTSDSEPVGAVALYEAPELAVSVYVSWIQDDVGMFGTAEQAVEDLGLSGEEAANLTCVVRTLEAGHDLTVSLHRAAAGPTPT